jgi:hypothetical protein
MVIGARSDSADGSLVEGRAGETPAIRSESWSFCGVARSYESGSRHRRPGKRL